MRKKEIAKSLVTMFGNSSFGNHMVLRKEFVKCLASVFALFLGVSTAQGGIPLRLKYATHFHIEYLKNGCKIVTDGAGRKLLLVPRGQEMSGLPPASPVIRIPVKRVVTRWSTIPSLLQALGKIRTIVGVTARREESCNEQIHERLAQGTVETLGAHGTIDYEKLCAVNPDVFFVSRWEKTNKLNELAIPYAVITEYLEDHPLGRMEWIKFFAAFYNKEKEANGFFAKAVRNVQQLSQKIEKVKKRPRVLWGFIRREGTIYAPRGKCYVNRMIAIAGGDSVLKGLRRMGGAPISLEQFYEHGRDAAIYICPEPLPRYGITSIKKLIAIHPILTGFKSVREGNVWCFQPWYWESIDKTDDVIEDLAAIFHPKLFPGHRPGYFLKLPER